MAIHMLNNFGLSFGHFAVRLLILFKCVQHIQSFCLSRQSLWLGSGFWGPWFWFSFQSLYGVWGYFFQVHQPVINLEFKQCSNMKSSGLNVLAHQSKMCNFCRCEQGEHRNLLIRLKVLSSSLFIICPILNYSQKLFFSILLPEICDCNYPGPPYTSQLWLHL